MFARKLGLPVLLARLVAGRRVVLQMDKRQQFGNRFLTDPEKVFEHNAWDNVEWDEDQETEARKKVSANSECLVESEKQDMYEKDANRFWDEFYSIHQNRFFKDRHWLFTEFPELLGKKSAVNSNVDLKVDVDHVQSSTSQQSTISNTEKGSELASAHQSVSSKSNLDPKEAAAPSSVGESFKDENNVDVLVQETVTEGRNSGEHVTSAKDISGILNKADVKPVPDTDANESETVGEDCVLTEQSKSRPKEQLLEETKDGYPGMESSFRIFEVGCGVGNTVYPVLQTNNDDKLFVYCCDLSDTAIQLVKEHEDYQSGRCHAFVCDITEEGCRFPLPEGSLDVITLIFVLSAIHPDKMQWTINRLARYLKPGGRILFRDYGRYDMAQLRFKNGRCLSENFYVRGDGTRVYFFTQEELQTLFSTAGLLEDQNIIDRRLQVNRGRQLKMYRVWIQCKYRKPIE